MKGSTKTLVINPDFIGCDSTNPMRSLPSVEMTVSDNRSI